MLGLLSFGKAAVLDEAVTWMSQNDLTIFKTVTDYKPNNYIRRDEAAKLFVKFAKLKNKTDYVKTTEECKFSDLNDAHADLKDIVIESCRLGIFQWANGKFMPKGSLTNEQAVAVLLRVVGEKQSEVGLSSRSDNYYNRAYELWILWQVTMWDRKIIATRGNVGIILANASDNILNSILNIARYKYLDEIIQDIVKKEASEMYDNASYTEIYQLTSSQWATIKNKYLVVYQELWIKYNLSEDDTKYLRDTILIDFYYTMLREKQYDVAASLTESWSSTSKQLEDIYKNSWGIYINWNFKNIKNNTYQFIVNIRDSLNQYFEEFNVQKEISSNNKIKSISSKRVDKYLCMDMGCWDPLIPYDKWITLEKIWKEIDQAIIKNSAQGRLFSMTEYKRLFDSKLYEKERLNIFIKKPNVNSRNSQAPEYFLDTNFIYSIDPIKDTKGNRKYQFIFHNTSEKTIDIDWHLTLSVNWEDSPTLIYWNTNNGRIKTTVWPNKFQVILFDEDVSSKESMDNYIKNSKEEIWINWYLNGSTKKLYYSTSISF